MLIPSCINLLRYMIENARARGFSADHILRRACDCQIDAVLWGAMAKDAIPPHEIGLPEDRFHADLLTFKMTQTARIGLWQRTLASVVPALNKDGINCIVLKGPSLGIRLMDSEMWRNTSDLDLWIDRGKLEKAAQILEDHGYRCGIEPHLWATNQILYMHATLVPVELHWSLAPSPWKSPSFDEALSRAQTQVFRDIPIKTLADGDLYCHLLLHAHQHYFAPKTLVDLCAAIEKLNIDKKVLEECGLLRMNRCVRSALSAFGDVQPFGICQCTLASVIRRYLKDMLGSACGGGLIFGGETKLGAAFGVGVRALSMGLLDGYIYPAKAAADVILFGPHRLGKIMAEFKS